MGYKNELQDGLLLNISVADNLFANISSDKSRNAAKEQLAGSDDENEFFFVMPEIESISDFNTIYNMPFLLHSSGLPWDEANAYLCSLVENKHKMERPTEDVRRKASVLLDFKLFCESENLDWYDFSARRISKRPTYRYFFYLNKEKGLSPRVINQYTGYVYDFLEYVSGHWAEYKIDLQRVDKVDTIKIFFQHERGATSKDARKRSQTKTIPRKGSDPMGYVRDDGELLRPLTLEQWQDVLSIISREDWAPIERLLVLFSVMTGARKQSILTIRLKHIKMLATSKPGRDGTYKLHIGPGTLIDTKKSKSQVLHLPSQLVDELIVYGNCKNAMIRKEKFKEKYKIDYPYLLELDDDDIYLFLSDQGNCYYMGKDDPRYPIVKSKPIGQVVNNLKRKIQRNAPLNFPSNFYFHWLRATFAYLLWLALQKYVESDELKSETVISIIQNRLHHDKRETTENYLKLFNNIDLQIEAQRIFESFLFGELVSDKEDFM